MSLGRYRLAGVQLLPELVLQMVLAAGMWCRVAGLSSMALLAVVQAHLVLVQLLA